MGLGGEQGSFRFGREEHLKRRNEIREVFARGKRFGCRSSGGGGAKLFVLQNGLDRCRICFTFSRGFGNAVERNRARRLGREAYRHLRNRLVPGYDIILLTHPAASSGLLHKKGQPACGTDRKRHSETLISHIRQLEFLFGKAGLLS